MELVVNACPFCKSDDTEVCYGWQCYYVQCQDCNAEGSAGDSREQAAENWNNAILDVSNDRLDAARYRKLRGWMSSNVKDGWSEVEKLSAIACYLSWDDFDASLDGLPECNVGLMEKRV
jgi:hypothetical protein